MFAGPKKVNSRLTEEWGAQLPRNRAVPEGVLRETPTEHRSSRFSWLLLYVLTTKFSNRWANRRLRLTKGALNVRR